MTFSPSFPPNHLRAVDIVAFPAVQVLDVVGPLQVFASANVLAAEAGTAPPYVPRVVAQSSSVVCSAGLGLVAEVLPPVKEPLDTLIVAGGQGVDDAAANPALLEWVQARAATVRRTASVCTGAFILAAAGLLDGRCSATHWSRCNELARRYPAVRVEADPIFIQDGPIWTSAGVTAGIDLALALVEQDVGRALALRVARDLVVFLKRPGGQAQFSAALMLQEAGGSFSALHDWIGRNLDGDLSLATLARQAGMSERSFSRRYANATGRTPARAVEQLRVEAARHYLADTRLPLKVVAQRCGFGSEEIMRRCFHRILATSPQDYRTRFGSR
jgi:transcriptional regulator GlxA family with amidase domain